MSGNLAHRRVECSPEQRLQLNFLVVFFAIFMDKLSETGGSLGLELTTDFLLRRHLFPFVLLVRAIDPIASELVSSFLWPIFPEDF